LIGTKRLLRRCQRFLAANMLITGLLLATRLLSAQASMQTDYAADLQAYMDKQMAHYKIPGAAIAIVREGEVEYVGGFGTANDQGTAVTGDTAFLIASLSKSFTAAAVLQLVEEGKLNLDDPARKHLPWFAVAGGEGGAITVADLLYHTSGFSEVEGLEATLQPDSPTALEDGVRDLAYSKLKFEPGTDWEYSNLNYATLGAMVEELSGQPFEAYIEEHIFDRLDMTHSYSTLSDAREGTAASGYYPFFDLPLRYDAFMPYSRATLPAGGLWSSASDMSHYLVALLNDGRQGENTLLSAGSVTRMFQPGYVFDTGESYAMGWNIYPGFLDHEMLQSSGSNLLEYDGALTTIMHEGDWANFNSVALLIPEIDYGMVILMNNNDPTVDSGLRGFAWDVTLIATNGEAQYFPPWEESFVVQNSRWLFALITLLLIAEFIWSLRLIVKMRSHDQDEPSRRTLPLHALLPLLIDIGLVAIIFFKFLPDNSATLPILIHHTPDLGLLLILILLLTVGWGTVRTLWIGFAYYRRRQAAPTTSL
jgi:CubicO group peptidase (beta-lactamase class C family)